MRRVAWRIYKTRYAGHGFDREGARQSGGRFNSNGTPVVYVAGSLPLAVLEMLVHIQRSQLLSAYLHCEVVFDDSIVTRLDRKRLPKHWRNHPPPEEVQRIGDEWVAGGTSAVLDVPSAVLENEVNYLVNPNHADFGKITIGAEKPFDFPPRLVSPA